MERVGLRGGLGGVGNSVGLFKGPAGVPELSMALLMTPGRLQSDFWPFDLYFPISC